MLCDFTILLLLCVWLSMDQDSISLLDAFRYHYNRLVESVHHITNNATDTVVIERLMNDLTEYRDLVNEVRTHNISEI